MKILQVCTLISPDGAFGGPVRVAVNQTRALREAGHEVTLLAGAQGYKKVLPSEYDGVPVRLFPARRAILGTGFAGLASPQLLRYIKSAAKTVDVLHVHMARDLVTLPVAAWAKKSGVPYVLQTHGMIDPSGNPLAVPLDAIWTRPVLAAAESVLYLTEVEKDGLDRVSRNPLSFQKLGNGVPLAKVVPNWEETGQVEVLFLARLHARKRPNVFIEMATSLAAAFPDVSFRLVGPDEGEGAACTQAIEDARLGEALAWEGPLAPELTQDRLAAASIYVLPSVNEPFPMSVLEAMSLGKPVVVTNSCGIAESIAAAGAGIVVDDTAESLHKAVHRLLSDSSLRLEMGRNALALAHENFGMDGVVKTLCDTYERATARESSAVIR